MRPPIIKAPHCLPRAANDGRYHQELKMLVNPSLELDLLRLKIITHYTSGEWPNRKSHYKLNLHQARLMGLTRSTAYRWIANPPKHFQRMLNQLAELQREAERLQMHSLPRAWTDEGWRFADGRLVLGRNYANAYQFEHSELVGIRFNELRLLDQVRDLRVKVEKLSQERRYFEPVNDAYYG